MRIPFLRRRRRADSPPARHAALEQVPDWMRQPTEVFPTIQPGRVGNLTPAGQFRASGGRR